MGRGERHVGADAEVAPSARPTLAYGYGSVVDTRRTEVMECPVFPDADPASAEEAETIGEPQPYPGVPQVLIGQCRETSMFPSSLEDDEVTPTVSDEAGQPTLKLKAGSRASRKSRRAEGRERPVLDAVTDETPEALDAKAALHRERTAARISMLVEVLIAVLIAAALVLGVSALLTPA